MGHGEVREQRDLDIETADNQFVTFYINDELYGIPVLQVQEIIGMTKITSVPNSLPYMKGVIDLRGEVVPVIDMRNKFGMPETEYSSFTVIIIVEVGDRLVGMVVDSVSDVLNIPVKDMREMPQLSSKVQRDFIDGIGQCGSDLVIILNAERILTTEELNRIDNDTPSDGSTA